jgi:hypothetical protein
MRLAVTTTMGMLLERLTTAVMMTTTMPSQLTKRRTRCPTP